MTIREKLHAMLVEHGLWPDEATTVLKLAEDRKEMESMRGRWDESTDSYPYAMMAVLLVSVKKIAVDWLKENKPRHFAIGILDTN